MTAGQSAARAGAVRRSGLAALVFGLALVASTPRASTGADLSVGGSYLLEPQVVYNLDLDAGATDDRRVDFIGQQFKTTLSLRAGSLDAAIGFELADGLVGRQNFGDAANPFDDTTTLQLSPDTGASIIDFFAVRWDMALGDLRAGWFTPGLDSYRLFLGRHGAPSVQLDVPLGVVELQYTFQKVAERGAPSTPSTGSSASASPDRTGDVDAHYLRLQVRAQDLGPVQIRRAAAWGVHAADGRPEDKSRVVVVGGYLDLRLGPLMLYGEGNYLGGEFDGSEPAVASRGPGSTDDETITRGATLRGHVGFFGAGLDLGDTPLDLPLTVGVEALRGSGDRDPGDGRVEDLTSLAIIHRHLDTDFELSRLFGTFALADHSEYMKSVGNLTVVKPFLVASVGRRLKAGVAAYRLMTTRSVPVTLGGTATGERSRDLGWQYEGSLAWIFNPGVTASLLYAYLAPGAALRPGGDPAQLVYTSIQFRF
jgi:hypothetical protein